MKNFNSAIPYFTRSELACKCCGVVSLDMVFAIKLPLLRHSWGKGLTPSSVCRCGPHNTRVGGHKRSLHLMDNPVHPTNGTCAVDIKWGNWSVGDQLAFAKLAYFMGWSVGLDVSFIHIDSRVESAELPQAVYTYSNWDGRFEALAVTVLDTE